ncbi:hypothetical protein [Pectobacterium phage Wc4-1]|uniref:Cyanophage baseplate Pam3 plug gp18 domain-containing protein n=3 Tax=Arnovirus TaxID=3425109 RepID=A0A5P8D477_9CAUD|nr:hypothetical protein Arno162_91 [Pectobacterium phage Arno162]AZV02278.1 hypothetical protein Arno18_92 [Pectobacterium phage Arno18]QFP93858.1 hypothetical protein [Pectobacterium phage Wc4]QFP94003.1 hypothetical protein [Pectobacterium phage Wc4-1]
MAYNITVPDDENSVQTVTLGGTTFRLGLKYKARTQRWYLSLYDNDDNPLLTEKKLVDGQSITGLWDIEGMFGEIFCERSYGTDIYPSRDTLGIDKPFNLVYYTAEEMSWILRL